MTETVAAGLISQKLDAIYGYAYARLYEKDQAEDLAAEIVCAMLALAKNCRDDRAFWGFAWKIAKNTLRRYEVIIEDCTDTDIYSKAVLGKIMVLRFLERIKEADWSAEFGCPDINIKTATQALSLFEEGQTLLSYLENEDG